MNAQAVETGGRHYAVELFDLGSRVNLNKELVVLQHAKYTEDGPVCLTQDDESVFQQVWWRASVDSGVLLLSKKLDLA